MKEINFKNVDYIQASNKIIIPNKLHKVVDFLDKDLLLRINKDIKVAKELCLLFISFLNETQFENYINGKHLNSKLLMELLRHPIKSKNTRELTYKRIIECLMKGTDNGPIIELVENYSVGRHSNKYNLCERYKKGFRQYNIKTEYVKQIKLRNYLTQMFKAENNDLAKNSLMMYAHIELPTSEELLEIGKRLIKEEHITNSGKKLTMRHRQKNEHWSDWKKRSFVEDDIKIFEFYTKYGFIIPIVGDAHCPRVYDSINLLPRWIRKEIKINDNKTIEADYSCLHPNLTQTIYNGKLEYITHQQVADYLGVDLMKVKTEHLSFFNDKAKILRHYDVFNYYKEMDKLTLMKVIDDKDTHKSHKITSVKSFKLETDLMERVIRKLNSLGIYVIYVFDAVEIDKQYEDIVNALMNVYAYEMNVKTRTKKYFDLDECYEIIKKYEEKLLDEQPNKWFEEYLYDEDYETITSEELFKGI